MLDINSVKNISNTALQDRLDKSTPQDRPILIKEAFRRELLEMGIVEWLEYWGEEYASDIQKEVIYQQLMEREGWSVKLKGKKVLDLYCGLMVK